MDAVIEYGDVGKFILELLNDYDVIAPVEKDNRYIFEQVDDPSKIVHNYDTTILPPVKWIYPNNEVLLRFKLSDLTEVKPVNAFRNQVLLFVHPCDINAINIMDEILAEEPADTNYLARRRSSIIIGYDCACPCRENILCFDKGYHKADKGFDIFFTDLGNRFFVSTATDIGKTIVEKSNAFSKAGYSDKTGLTKTNWERDSAFKKKIHGDINRLSHVLKDEYEDAVWEVEGKKCLSCGACVIVCPTCYCFDVVDEVCPDMETGLRYRRWDGCQIQDFCLVASGENFRDSAAERVRHRVFKKEVYLKKRFGRSGCVGCGRCIEHCIADISIIDIFNHVMERKKGHGEI